MKRILIAGAQRSGTTLVYHLMKHFPSLAFAEPEHRTTEAPIYLSKKEKKKLYPKLSHFSEVPFTFSSKKPTPDTVYKWPSYSRLPVVMNFLKELKNVQIIFIIRDGRDVITSILRGRYHVNMNQWIVSAKLFLELQRGKRDNVFLYKYEDLVRDVKTFVGKLETFIDREIDKNYMPFSNLTIDEVEDLGAHNIKRVHTDNIGRWRNHQHQPRISEAFRRYNIVEFSELLIDLGYETDHNWIYGEV